jgi:hypothetical protein
MTVKIKKVLFLMIVVLFLTTTCDIVFAAEKKGILVTFWERIKAKWSARKEAQTAKEKPIVQERLKPVAPAKEISPLEEIKTAVPTTSPVKEEIKLEKEGLEAPVEKIAGEETAEKKEVIPAAQEEKKEEAPPAAGKVEEVEKGIEDIEEIEEIEEPETGEAAEGEKKPREIPYSNEEMIAVIKKRLTTFQQILYMIPGLSMQKPPEGEAEYFYESPEKPGAKPLRLSELDKDTVYKIFVRVNNEATRLQTERLMQQLQQQENLMRTIQQQQNLQRQQQIIQQQQQLNQQRSQQQQQPPPAPPPQTRR